MPSRRRVVLAILFVLVVLAGAGLFLLSNLVTTQTLYNTSKNVCNFQYAIELNPLQTRQNNCVALQNDWVSLSVRSNSNLTLSISLAKVGGGEVILYNNTSNSLNASFPLGYSGAIVATLHNSFPTVAAANGSLTVNSVYIANATTTIVDHPFRFEGEALIAIGALGLFLVAWNPKIPSLAESNPPKRSSEFPTSFATR
jgi:hypothetical protein